MTENFNEIKQMSKLQFKNIVKKKAEQAPLTYLLSQIKEKGKEMKYGCLEMQEYLYPDAKLSLKEEKKHI